MRLSIQLDDDLHARARAHALAFGTSIRRAINDLLRRRIPVAPPATPGRVDPLTGLPVVAARGAPVTLEDVRQAEDEDLPVRHVAEEP